MKIKAFHGHRVNFLNYVHVEASHSSSLFHHESSLVAGQWLQVSHKLIGAGYDMGRHL